MLMIKLQRVGRRHQPSFRVVVAEKRSKLKGPPVEDLGAYNPFTKESTLVKDRVSHWLKIGAQPTATVYNLLVRSGVVQGKKIAIRIRKAKQEETGKAATPPPQAQAEGAPQAA